MVNDDLAAKTLREKCIKGDALRRVSHLDDLQEIWDTLDTCLERRRSTWKRCFGQ